jgi:hypothetical protein
MPFWQPFEGEEIANYKCYVMIGNSYINLTSGTVRGNNNTMEEYLMTYFRMSVKAVNFNLYALLGITISNFSIDHLSYHQFDQER